MKIKHFAGYGSVQATRVKDKKHTLHIQVRGNHEWGLRRDDQIDLFRWLVSRFDKSFKDFTWVEWQKLQPRVEIVESFDYDKKEDVCDYIFDY